jgi:adenine-specific DNA-methyltransferase
MFYPLTSPEGNQVFPLAPEGWESRWVCIKDTYDKLLAAGEIEWKKVSKGDSTRWQVYQKHYLKDAGKETSDLWSKVDGNKMGTKELSRLFDGRKLFSHPKPVGVIARILRLGSKGNGSDIILDFFSGSATTAHAVMQLNAEDGGRRRHIMVQLPEPCDEKSEAFKAGYKTIAEIGKERIRRAGKKILQEWQAKQAKEQPAQGDLLSPENLKLNTENSGATAPDVGFRVLKIADSNFREIERTPEELEQLDLLKHTEHIKPDRTPEDLLFQVLVDWGVDLALPIVSETLHGKRVFFVDENALAACFDTGLSDELVHAIAARKPLRAVFRDDGFGDDSTRINVEQIFKLLSPNTEVKAL